MPEVSHRKTVGDLNRFAADPRVNDVLREIEHIAAQRLRELRETAPDVLARLQDGGVPKPEDIAVVLQARKFCKIA